MKIIEIKRRECFGRVDYLPANETAEAFCALLNKPNLPLDAIHKLRKMGYEVNEVLEKTI